MFSKLINRLIVIDKTPNSIVTLLAQMGVAGGIPQTSKANVMHGLHK